jgi:hypothetical protein
VFLFENGTVLKVDNLTDDTDLFELVEKIEEVYGMQVTDEVIKGASENSQWEFRYWTIYGDGLTKEQLPDWAELNNGDSFVGDITTTLEDVLNGVKEEADNNTPAPTPPPPPDNTQLDLDDLNLQGNWKQDPSGYWRIHQEEDGDWVIQIDRDGPSGPGKSGDKYDWTTVAEDVDPDTVTYDSDTHVIDWSSVDIPSSDPPPSG